MSDATFPSMDLREQIVRIDRAIAETEKFSAETRKLISESTKLDRDSRAVSWQVTATALAAFGALLGSLVTALKVMGVL